MFNRFFFWLAIAFFIVTPLRLWQCFSSDLEHPELWDSQPFMHNPHVYGPMCAILAVAGIVLILHVHMSEKRR